jgi:hypothetical protein
MTGQKDMDHSRAESDLVHCETSKNIKKRRELKIFVRNGLRNCFDTFWVSSHIVTIFWSIFEN